MKKITYLLAIIFVASCTKKEIANPTTLPPEIVEVNGMAITIHNQADNSYKLLSNSSGDLKITIDTCNRMVGKTASIYIETDDISGNTITFMSKSTLNQGRNTATNYIGKRMIATVKYAGNDEYFIAVN